MEKASHFFLVFAATVLLYLASQVVADIPEQYVDQELILTQQEKIAFDKFKAAVYPNITKEWKDYIGQELFLLRWIRAKNLDVESATYEMFEFIDFLQTNKIDKILDEDFGDLAPDFPVHIIQDREGRPVLHYSASEGWNVRRGILQGKRARMVRFTYKIAFQMLRSLIDINKKQPNVTQALVLMNMDGFNVFQHSCPACISTYLNLLDVYERYLPGYVKEIIVINATQAYLVLLEVLRPVLSPYTRKSLHVFGTNKNKWKPYLEERIDLKRLPWDFGGNKLERA